MGVALLLFNDDACAEPPKNALSLAWDSFENMLDLARLYGFEPQSLDVPGRGDVPLPLVQEFGWHSNDGACIPTLTARRLAAALRRAWRDRPHLDWESVADTRWWTLTEPADVGRAGERADPETGRTPPLSPNLRARAELQGVLRFLEGGAVRVF